MPLPRIRNRRVASIAVFVAALVAAAPGRAALFGFGNEPPSYETARVLFDRGDVRGAIAELKRFLKVQPAHGAARLLIGRALIRSGSGPSAEEQLRRAAELGADPDQLAIATARSYLLQRKFGELLTDIGTSDRPPEIQATVAYLRGLAHYGLGQLDDADHAFAAVLARIPKHVGASLARARVRIARLELDEAENLVVDIATRSPDTPDAWHLSGEIARLRGDTAGAVAAYDRALAIAASHVPARLARAAVLIDTDRMRDAAADIELVQNIAPSDPQARLLKAMVMARSGRASEAKSVVERLDATLDHQNKALRADSSAHALLAGIVDYVRDTLDASLQAFERYLAFAPNHADSRILISRIHGERGDFHAAISTLQPVLSSETATADAFAQLGGLYVRAGRLDKAESVFEKALARSPESRSLSRRLALIRLAIGRSTAEDRVLEDLFRTVGPTRGGVLVGLLRLGDHANDEALVAARSVAAVAPGSAFAHNLAGVVRARQGDLNKARAHFKQAKALEPDYIPALFNLAAAEAADGEPASAQERYRHVLTLAPRDRAAMIELSRLAETAGDRNAAIDWLAKALERKKDDLPTALALADLFMRAGRYDDVLNMEMPLGLHGRRDKRLLEAKARAYLATGDVDSATRLYRDVSSAATGTADELNRIARIQQRLGDVKGAIFTFKTAMAVDVANREARNGALELEAPSGGTDRELIYAEALRDRYPDSGIGHIVAGNAWSRADRHDKAAASYAEALRLEPWSGTALRRFRALERAGEPQRARRFLEHWTDAHPEDRTARRELAFASIRAGRLNRAKKLFETKLAAAPQEGVVLNNLAWLSARLGDGNALSYARRALASRPDDPAVLDTYAMILVDGGEPGQGLELLRRAQRNGAPDARLHYHAALALHRLGRRAAARTELEAALRTDRSFADADEARRLLRALGGA